MKKYLTLFLCFFSSYLFAASITVDKFNIEFYLPANEYTVDFKLKLACRYEKFVISDSSEYEYTFKDVNLIVKETPVEHNQVKINLINPNKVKHEMRGFFRSNKACQSMVKFFLVSKKYSIGWLDLKHRPITLGIFEHTTPEELVEFEISKYKDLLEDKTLHFQYNNRANQSWVKFAIDDIPYDSMSFYSQQMISLDPSTNLPYALQPK